jgi:hypothetical protein
MSTFMSTNNAALASNEVAFFSPVGAASCRDGIVGVDLGFVDEADGDDARGDDLVGAVQ